MSVGTTPRAVRVPDDLTLLPWTRKEMFSGDVWFCRVGGVRWHHYVRSPEADYVNGRRLSVRFPLRERSYCDNTQEPFDGPEVLIDAPVGYFRLSECPST